MKPFSGTPGLSHLLLSWMAAVSTAAWALAGTADTPREPATRAHAASGPHSDGADAVLQSRQRSGATGKAARNDQQFLSKAAASGRAEVEMGHLGQFRAQNSEVKDFADRMVRDHTRVNGELQALRSSRGLSWPDEDGAPGATASSIGHAMGSASGVDSGARSGTGASANAGSGWSHLNLTASARHSLERLQGLTGADFDREFMKQMVTDHKAAVADFQRAAASASDPEVKTFAQKTLPTLQEHLQMARSLSQRLAGSGRH